MVVHGLPVVVISQGRVCFQNGKVGLTWNVFTCTDLDLRVFVCMFVFHKTLCNMCLGGGCEGLWKIYSSSAILGHCLLSYPTERQGESCILLLDSLTVVF